MGRKVPPIRDYADQPADEAQTATTANKDMLVTVPRRSAHAQATRKPAGNRQSELRRMSIQILVRTLDKPLRCCTSSVCNGDSLEGTTDAGDVACCKSSCLDCDASQCGGENDQDCCPAAIESSCQDENDPPCVFIGGKCRARWCPPKAT